MRIAFYAPLKSPRHRVPSGDRSMARLLMAALAAAGHEVVLASELRAYAQDEAGAAQAGIAAAGAAEAGRLLAMWRGAPRTAPDLWFTYHLYYRAPDHLGPAVAGALGIPYAVAEASLAMKRAAGAWAPGHAAVARALAMAEVVFCLTQEDKPGLAGAAGLTAPLVDLPPFVAPGPSGEVAPDPALRGLARPRVLAVGMMRARAKLESYRLLAGAMAGLGGLPWSLAIVGDGPMRHEVERLFAPLGARVAFLGERPAEAMAAVYAGADLLAWPGVGEAFGMVYLEAQAAGLPVVAMAHRGVANVVREAVSGRLVAAGDEAGFAAALAELIGDGPSRRALGASARAFVATERSLAMAATVLGRALGPFPPAAKPSRTAPRQPSARGRPMNVLIWVTHLLGVGHFHRAVRIARAIAREGARVTVATGGFPIGNVRLGDFEVVQLPPLKSPDVTFKRLVGPDGDDVGDDYLNRRRDELVELARRLRPAAILTELFPFGRWKFQSELVPLMEEQRARADRPAILASIRDILVPPRQESRLASIRRLVLDHYDGILVHGDAGFIRLEDTLPLAAEFTGIVAYTGYVVPDHDPAAGGRDGAGEVVVSAGGSAFGGHLLKTAIQARPRTRLAQAPWRVLVGPGLSAGVIADLKTTAAEQSGIIVERARADFPELLTRARLSISQAGYNTVCDVLAAGLPAVLAPFAEADESEQSQRVQLLAARGLATAVAEDPLTVAALAAAVDAAADRPPDRAAMPLLDGGRNTARAVLDAARRLGHG